MSQSQDQWWRRLSLEQWSHIAQLVGTIGVIVALFSLFYQVQENTRALRLSAMASTLSTYNAVRLELMGNPALSRVAIEGFEDRQALNAADRLRFDTYLQYLFYSGHAHFTRTRLVEADSGLWSSSVAWYQSLVQQNPGVASWWCEQRESFHQDFVQTLEAGWKSGCPRNPPAMRPAEE